MTSLLVVALSLVAGDVNSRRSPVVQVVDKVSPAVVYVGTVQLVETRFRRGGFDDFFISRIQPTITDVLHDGVVIEPCVL